MSYGTLRNRDRAVSRNCELNSRTLGTRLYRKVRLGSKAKFKAAPDIRKTHARSRLLMSLFAPSNAGPVVLDRN